MEKLNFQARNCISNMAFESLNSIREFIYTGKIEVNIETVFDILEIAIDIGYCDLQRVLSDYFATNFQNILTSKKFLKMSAAAIKMLFAHKDLKESSESLICSHLLRWLEHNPEEMDFNGRVKVGMSSRQ